MRVVLSRKGIDSSPQSGGAWSPILPGGTPLWTPIRAGAPGVRYADLDHGCGGGPARSGGIDVTAIVREAEPRATLRWPRQWCHLDPDLERNARKDRETTAWEPALGQVGAAQAHLDNQGVGPGDLFLFFAAFRPAEHAGGRWRWTPGGRTVHRLFGWLAVRSTLRPEQGDALPATLCDHPHASGEWAPNNTLWTAAPALGLADGSAVAGAGWFRDTGNPALVLTGPGGTGGHSAWRLPAFMHPASGARLSYHGDPARWGPPTDGSVPLKAVARGQEFVLAGADPDALAEWLSALFRNEPRLQARHRESNARG